MTKGLIRYYGTRQLHFITCSCYDGAVRGTHAKNANEWGTRQDPRILRSRLRNLIGHLESLRTRRGRAAVGVLTSAGS
jgi:hypothetical protein